MEKILILGGKPIGSCEIVNKAKEMGFYTIVTDFLDEEQSLAKKVADEHWEISTAEVKLLKEKCIEENVKSIITGVHEFNIKRKIELCESLNLPQYCTREQWDFCENKSNFKEMCKRYNIDIAKTYSLNDINKIKYPVIVKPTDSSGSRGFSICNNETELLQGIDFALKFSESKQYLIEEYIQSDACIIHYTAIDGEILFSGISDKYSKRLESGASVMALQIFPSKSKEYYLKNINHKVQKMFKDIGIKNGPIWIEAFNDIKNNRFIFNEMGFRFGGSMTNYPVEFFYGIDQIECMILNSLGKKYELKNNKIEIYKNQYYCILPIHIKPGKIQKIMNLEKIEELSNVEHVVLVHHNRDNIENWGSAQNVFAYIHISYNKNEELINTINVIKQKLSVKDTNNNEMLYTIFDFDKLKNMN